MTLTAKMCPGVDRVPERVTILMAAPPTTDQSRQGLELARRLRADGVAVFIFFYSDGVLHMRSTGLETLAASGVQLYACFESCRRHGISIDNNVVILGGLITLAGLIETSDTLEAFT